MELILDIETAPGVETLTPSISGITEDDNKYSIIVGAAITAGVETAQVYPGLLTVAAPFGTVGKLLPKRWQAEVVHSASSAWTYKLWANLYK